MSSELFQAFSSCHFDDYGLHWYQGANCVDTGTEAALFSDRQGIPVLTLGGARSDTKLLGWVTPSTEKGVGRDVCCDVAPSWCAGLALGPWFSHICSIQV